MPSRTRRDYIERKIALALQRQRHWRERSADCACPLCISTERLDAILKARLDAQEAANGPPPF